MVHIDLETTEATKTVSPITLCVTIMNLLIFSLFLFSNEYV